MINQKTSKKQALRKIEGTKIEHIVSEIVYPHLKRTQRVQINTKEGIDLFIRNGIILDIEVKSANEKTLYKKKDNTYGYRTGRFLIKMEDYIRADLFAFAIKKMKKNNTVLKWTGEIKVYFINAEVVRDYLKGRHLYKTRKNVKIGITAVKKFPRIYLESYLKKIYR